MPFEWMTVRKSPELAKALARRRDEMYLAELEERAGLLQRLRYTKEQTRTRLAGNLRWDFEQTGKPPRFANQVDAIVDRVFGRGSRKGE